MKMSNLFRYGVILLSFIICSETQPDNTKKTINLNNAKSIISELKIDGLNKEYSNCILDGLENKYGIDIPDRRELISYNQNIKEIEKRLRIDKLFFQKISDLKKSIQTFNDKLTTFEMSILDDL